MSWSKKLAGGRAGDVKPVGKKLASYNGIYNVNRTMLERDYWVAMNRNLFRKREGAFIRM